MGYEQMQNNRAYVAGTVITVPEFSHEVLGEKFYDVTLSVRRLSDRHDEIPVTVSDRLMQDMPLAPGDTVGVSGQLRSYNKQTEGRSKLVLRIFARELDDGESDTPNRIELEGFVCKPPVYRTTPFKREICDMLLAVNRAYNKSDYIPAIAWGRNARYAGIRRRRQGGGDGAHSVARLSEDPARRKRGRQSGVRSFGFAAGKAGLLSGKDRRCGVPLLMGSVVYFIYNCAQVMYNPL